MVPRPARAAAALAVALTACRGGSGASAEDGGLVAVRGSDAELGRPAPAPPAIDAAVAAPSAACTEGLGSIVARVEEVIVEAPGGRLVRVWDRCDPFATSDLVVVATDGTARHDWRDAAAELLLPAEPAIHAQICAAELGGVVRCLPGDSFTLPDGTPCTAPRRRGGRVEALLSCRSMSRIRPSRSFENCASSLDRRCEARA